tara:strand:- start:110 stop:490 length:381 start_codon:yes stop_codon:yes gene_type:complete
MNKSLLIIVAMVFFVGCEENVEEDYNNGSENGMPTYDCDELRSYYTGSVQPILDSKGCTGCHATSGPAGGLALDSFESVHSGIVHGSVLDRVGREPGEPGFMPQGGTKLSQDQLDILQGFSGMECP